MTWAICAAGCRQGWPAAWGLLGSSGRRREQEVLWGQQQQQPGHFLQGRNPLRRWWSVESEPCRWFWAAGEQHGSQGPLHAEQLPRTPPGSTSGVIYAGKLQHVGTKVGDLEFEGSTHLERGLQPCVVVTLLDVVVNMGRHDSATRLEASLAEWPGVRQQRVDAWYMYASDGLTSSCSSYTDGDGACFVGSRSDMVVLQRANADSARLLLCCSSNVSLHVVLMRLASGVAVCWWQRRVVCSGPIAGCTCW
jgi:hypothetical protein